MSRLMPSVVVVLMLGCGPLEPSSVAAKQSAISGSNASTAQFPATVAARPHHLGGSTSTQHREGTCCARSE